LLPANRGRDNNRFARNDNIIYTYHYDIVPVLLGETSETGAPALASLSGVAIPVIIIEADHPRKPAAACREMSMIRKGKQRKMEALMDYNSKHLIITQK